MTISTKADGRVLLLFHGNVDIDEFIKSKPIDTTSETNKRLISRLDPLTFEMQTAALGRVDRLLHTQDNVCAINRIKTPSRERTSYFSTPINLYLSIRLYFPEKLQIPAKLLNDKGRLTSMAELFDAMPRKILGLTQDRSYGEAYDDMLVAIKTRNLFVRGGGSTFDSMFTLMEKGRFEFLLDYPETVKRARKNLSRQFALKSLEVEGIKPYIVGYIECARSPTTEHFLKQANQVLYQLYRTRQFKLAHTRYLDEADVERFEHYYQKVYLGLGSQ